MTTLVLSDDLHAPTLLAKEPLEQIRRSDHALVGGREAQGLDTLVGDVHELELETGESRSRTAHFEHRGFTRALPRQRRPVALRAGWGFEQITSRWKTELWFLPRGGNRPAQRLKEPFFERPAVWRRIMQIAWTRSDYPDELVFARSEMPTWGRSSHPPG